MMPLSATSLALSARRSLSKALQSLACSSVKVGAGGSSQDAALPAVDAVQLP